MTNKTILEPVRVDMEMGEVFCGKRLMEIKMTSLGKFALAAVAAFAAAGAQANKVQVFDITGTALEAGGTQYTAQCNPLATVCMKAFYEVTGTTSLELNDSTGTGYKANDRFAGSLGDANPSTELAFLNNLLDELGRGDPDVTFVDKSDAEGDQFTSGRQYFSIKQADWTAFFENVSGKPLTVFFDPNNFSHYTEYGDNVPLPAAAWLFGSAIVGVGLVARRRRTDKLEAVAA
jgi:hypothetical protein